jgi:hypothetical protein
MVGFALPKLRWLLVGAVGAGVWAMTQEPPSKFHAQQRPSKTVERKAELPDKPKKTESPQSPRIDTLPAPRPSQVVTSSIARPDRPIADKAERSDNLLYTTSRVNMRATASTAAPIVATFGPGEGVKVIVRDGKWQLVAVRGRKGWIHADYLRPASADAPRPSLSVGKPVTNATLRADPPRSVAPQGYTAPRPENGGLLSAAKSLFGGRKPIRAPQEGDCQCPYDLMITGKQCGDHSAYSRRSRRNVQCYL